MRQLSLLHTELAHDLLADVLRLDAVHEQYESLLWQQLTVKKEAEACIIAHFLILVLSTSYEQQIDDVGVVIDHIHVCRIPGTLRDTRTLKVRECSVQYNLKVLRNSEAH